MKVSIGISLLVVTAPIIRSDILWPLYNQQCIDDAGPPFLDDSENFPNGEKYHDTSAAYAVLQPDGQCAPPLKEACSKRDNVKTAYLEGPIDCGDKGWYCRIMPDENWPGKQLGGDVNFAHCNTTDAFDDAGFDQDGHCHGSSKDSTYYWWIRDHFHRQYNGAVRCCCGWFEGSSSQPLYGRRIANRCDYRRLVTEEEDVSKCRDANEDHGMGFDDIGCNADLYQDAQLNKPIEEDDGICWEIARFGFTEKKYPQPDPVSFPVGPPVNPPLPEPTDTPTEDPTESPGAAPVAAPVTAPVAAPSDSNLLDCSEVDGWIKTIKFKKGDQTVYDSILYDAVKNGKNKRPDIWSTKENEKKNKWTAVGDCAPPPKVECDDEANWDVSTRFEEGETSVYEEVLYEAIKSNRKKRPDVWSTKRNPSKNTWTALGKCVEGEGADCEGEDAWDDSTRYEIEDQVTYEGSLYVAIKAAKNKEPDVWSTKAERFNKWENLGKC